MNRNLANRTDHLLVHLIEQYNDNCYKTGKHVIVEELIEKQRNHPAVSDSVPQRTKMCGILHGLGYRFNKITARHVLSDSNDVIRQRLEFLHKKQHLTALGYEFFYCDETWFSKA